MDLQKILDQWKTDCEIGQHELDEESRKVPALHAKYIELRARAKHRLKELKHQQYDLLKYKFLYYNGKLDKDAIKEKGWKFDPFDGLKVLKGDMNYYYNSDLDLQEAEEKVAYYENIIETLDEIINNLKWRHSTIKNMIDWRRFEAGG